MKLNSHFKLIDLTIRQNIEPIMSVSKYGLSFNKKCAGELGYPAHVQVFVNDVDKQLAVVVCEETENAKMKFYKKDLKTKNPKWTNKGFLKLVEKLGDMDLKTQSYQIKGELLDNGTGLVFNLIANESI